MVGHAFMGAAHSQAWRNAPRFFDLPLRPRMTALAGRDATRVADAASRLGWESTETSWQALVERDDIDLVDVCTPGRHARRDRDRCARGRQARALREAVGQHGGGGRGDGARRREGRGARHPVHGRLHLPPHAGHRPRPPARRRRSARRPPPRARPVPPGLDRRPAGTHVVAARQGQRRLRCARRHRRPHHRPRPVHHRRQHPPASPAGCDTFVDERPLPAEHAGLSGDRRVGHAAPSPSTTRPSSSPSSAGERWASSRPPASPHGRKNAIRLEVNGSAAAWPSTSRT